MSTAQEIVNEIVGHVGSDKHSDWYAGIAAKPRERLFNDHKVDEQTRDWIYRTADTNAAARSAEDALHKAGFKGGPGGGDSATTAVYAYKITRTTVE